MGVIYTLPVHFSELYANGWKPCDSEIRFATYILEPNDFITWELIRDNKKLGVTFTNRTGEARPIYKSYVTMFAALYSVYNAQVILPGNITVGSSYDEVISAYGEPCSWYASDDTTSLLFFYHTDYISIQVSINKETNQVFMTSIHYFM